MRRTGACYLLVVLIAWLLHGCTVYKDSKGAKRTSIGRNTDLEIIKDRERLYVAIGQEEEKAFLAAMSVVTAAIAAYTVTDIADKFRDYNVNKTNKNADIIRGGQRKDVAEEAIRANLLKAISR